MSIMHIVSCTINTKMNTDSLNKICKNIHQLNSYLIDEYAEKKINPLDTDMITNIFIQPSSERLDEGGPYIYVIYEDTGFSLRVAPHQDTPTITKISIEDFSPSWIKTFSSDETYIDFGRYIRFLLEIIKPYKILSIGTETCY